MSRLAEIVQYLVDHGVDSRVIAGVVRVGSAPKTTSAERMAALRARRKAQESDKSYVTTVTSVTSVTSDPSPPLDGPPSFPPNPLTIPPFIPPTSLPPSAGAKAPDAELFERGKAVLGKGEGATISKLLKAKGGNVALARAALEQASTKQDPKEYVWRIIRGPTTPQHANSPPGAKVNPDGTFERWAL